MKAGELCPFCGEPPRVAVHVKARVRVDLYDKPGRVLSVSKDESPVESYECGGGHKWFASQENNVGCFP